MDDDAKKLAFVRELMALEAKYGVYVDGCGCCDSPFLSVRPQDDRWQRDWDWHKGIYVGGSIGDTELSTLRRQVIDQEEASDKI